MAEISGEQGKDITDITAPRQADNDNMNVLETGVVLIVMTILFRSHYKKSQRTVKCELKTEKTKRESITKPLSSVYSVRGDDSDSDHDDDEVVDKQSKKWYTRLISECKCTMSCDREERNKSAISFGRMDQNELHSAVRAIMYALSSPKEVTNNSLKVFKERERKRQKLNTQHTSTVYLILGERVCQSEFCAIVQISKQTVNQIATSIADGKK